MNIDEKYEKIREKAKDNLEFGHLCMQLFEKQVLSGESLLDILGFDSNQEIKRREESTIVDKSHVVRESSLTIQSSRIEHARRNVEALTRLLNFTEFKDECTKAILHNIAVMSEVSKLK